MINRGNLYTQPNLVSITIEGVHKMHCRNCESYIHEKELTLLVVLNLESFEITTGEVVYVEGNSIRTAGKELINIDESFEYCNIDYEYINGTLREPLSIEYLSSNEQSFYIDTDGYYCDDEDCQNSASGGYPYNLEITMAKTCSGNLNTLTGSGGLSNSTLYIKATNTGSRYLSYGYLDSYTNPTYSTTEDPVVIENSMLNIRLPSNECHTGFKDV